MNEQKGFLLFLIALLGGVTFLMVKPFFTYVLGAIILAFMLYPLHQRFSRMVGGAASSAAMVTFAMILAVLPLILVTGAVIDDAQDLASQIDGFEAVNITAIEQSIEEYTGQNVDLADNLRTAVQEFSSVTFGSFSQLINLLTNLAIGFSLMVFLLYYLLKDGDSLVAWVREVLPLPPEIQDRLHERINLTTWAVIKGHVLVALLQGLVAGIGLYIAGVPNYFFWTFVMLILAFIPIIGSFLVWGPAAVYLIIIDRVPAGLFLLLYGAIVVGLTDNFVRPLVVDKSAEIHPASIIIGVLGGVYVFGAPGLFIGPIIIGVFKALVLVFKNNYKDL